MKEHERLMRQAADELRRVRQANHVLQAQAFVVEAFHAALLGRPGGEGMAPDVCWEIDRFLEEARQKEIRSQRPAAVPADDEPL
jgi:hypothetical protein